MSFKDYKIDREYRTMNVNIVKDFYMPLMGEAEIYQRAVGFFSSSSLACYSQGITQLIAHGGKIQLIASPHLSDEDRDAIYKGYELRDDVIKRSLIDSLAAPVDIYEEERLNLLATYIADGKLEIKIAFVDKNSKISIYHEKLGLLRDYEGNTVAFSGSMNESENGFDGNYETVDVFCSWIDTERVSDKIEAYSRIWSGTENGIIVKKIPELEKEILERYRRPSGVKNLHIDEEEYDFVFNPEEVKIKKIDAITIDMDALYDYQKEAIKNWVSNDYRGIYDMCTGAGKTYTAIGSIKKLYDDLDGNVAVIIVVPYQHLVEQWVEDLVKFNVHPIIGYGSDKYKGYKKDLKKAIFSYNLGVKRFLCFITTNSSFARDNLQNVLEPLNDKVLLIVDEAHNFGSESLSRTFYKNYSYRLALSATLDRHGDPEGTAKLYNFFEKKCVEYGLEEAIRDNKLTPYYYYPQEVYLSDSELERYEKITLEMKQYIYVDKDGAVTMSEKAKKLAIKRARIVAGAISKVSKLIEIIEPYKCDNNMLVYCGATTLLNEDVVEENLDEGLTEDIRQIDLITKLLGEELKMNVAQFTSNENMNERALLKQKFKDGSDLQTLVAIKCLDEGVNIPSIKTAFILASTTNPKEYIQRRGRVLRKAQGKDFAVIFDMVTLPRNLEWVKNASIDTISVDLSLVKNELHRVEEFKKLSLNPYDSNPLIDKIRDAYDLYEMDDNFEDIVTK